MQPSAKMKALNCKKTMLEGSNLGTSILKFGLFQFSKWLHLDQNANLGILVALLVLNDCTSVNAYKWTMGMQFQFEYCIDPKDHKSGEE